MFLDDICDVIGRVEEVKADVSDLKSDVEGFAGKILIGEGFVSDTAELSSRLKDKAEKGKPPTTFGLLMEVGSYLAKDR